MKELNKENLKQLFNDYISKWNDMIKTENEIPNDYSQEMIKQLETKISTFQYLIDTGIDENFK